MDVEEIKKFARNKIDAEALTKQMRDIIKTTKWQKQNMRECFKETFKPQISQFEKNLRRRIKRKIFLLKIKN